MGAKHRRVPDLRHRRHHRGPDLQDRAALRDRLDTPRTLDGVQVTTIEKGLPMTFALTPAQTELREKALAVGAELREHGARWDRDNSAPYRDVCRRMGELGLLGLTMPTEYGGQGGTALDYVIAVSSILRSSQTWVGPEPLFCTTGPGASM